METSKWTSSTWILCLSTLSLQTLGPWLKYKIYFHLKRSLWTTTNRENRSFMRIVKQNWFKNLGELHKEWTEAGTKEFGYSCCQRRLTWAKEKKNWTVTQSFSDEKMFCISLETKVLESGGRVEEAHSPICLKSSVKFQSVMIWCAMSSAGVGPLFFWKPTSLHPFTKKFWSTSCFLLLTSFLKILISFSSRICHLPTLPKAPKVD